MRNNLIETLSPRLAKLMIKKIETLTTDWHKPWIADLEQGLPRNLRGTPYKAGNILLLMILTELNNYKAPVFMTFRQAKEEGLTVLKGSESFPVYFWKMYIRHKETRKTIEPEVYHRLSHELKMQYSLIPVMRYYTVFNIDQTDMAEKQAERYTRLTRRLEPNDYSDGVSYRPLDDMLACQGWLCPIDLRYSDRAFYNSVMDRIVCPLKSQFLNGAAFYGTLLHEMTHSTGTKERLDRTFGTRFGDADYAREELVAEFTAALCGVTLGITTTLRDENAAYLQHWLSELRAKPAYLFDILSDVNKAVRIISEHLTIEASEDQRHPGAA